MLFLLKLIVVMQLGNVVAFEVERYFSNEAGDFLYVNKDQCKFVADSTWFDKFNVCKCFARKTFHILNKKMGCFDSSYSIDSECTANDTVAMVNLSFDSNSYYITVPSFFQRIKNVYGYTNDSWDSLIFDIEDDSNQIILVKTDYNSIDGKLIKLEYKQKNKQKCVLFKINGKTNYPFVTSDKHSEYLNNASRKEEILLNTKELSSYLPVKTIAAVSVLSCLLIIIVTTGGVLVYNKRRKEMTRQVTNNVKGVDHENDVNVLLAQKENEKYDTNIYATLILREAGQGEYGTLKMASIQDIKPQSVHSLSSAMEVEVGSSEKIQEPEYFEIEQEANITP